MLVECKITMDVKDEAKAIPQLERILKQNAWVLGIQNLDIKSNTSQNDYEQFLNGNLIVRINNSKEYLAFISQLDFLGCILGNRHEYGMDECFYNPHFPYYFMQSTTEKLINASVTAENIQKLKGRYNIPVKDYKNLDMLKVKKEEPSFISTKEIDLILQENPEETERSLV